MNVLKVSFESEELDQVMEKLLSGRIDVATRNELLQTLMHDHKFRENFSEWIKATRHIREWTLE